MSPKDPRRNKLNVFHLIFRPSWAAPQSRNPRRRGALRLRFRSIIASQSDPNLSGKPLPYFFAGPKWAAGLCRRKVFLWVSAALLILALGSFFFFDVTICRHFHRQRPLWYDNPWVTAYVQLGKTWVLLWLLFLGLWRRGLALAIVAGFASLVLVAPIVGSLKPIVSRERPSSALSPGVAGKVVKKAQKYSFPSGDTAAVFAVAGALGGCTRRRYAPMLIAAAGMVGALRVVSLNHYPSDALAGAAIGFFCAAAAMMIVEDRLPWLSNRVGPRTAWVGIGGMILVFCLSLVLEKRSSVVLFLTYYGPILAAGWLGTMALESRNRKRPS